MADRIFVNYRRDDAKAEAARLHDRLAQSFGAANVFMDVDNLLPGERFDLRLKEALAGTDVFLAVIGVRWLALLEARAQSGERDYVREEIAAALAAKLVVIPVLMDRAALPKPASLPEDIRELALYHKHDVVYESFGRDAQALITAIETHRQARDGRAVEAVRLAREREQAEIEAARRARRKANEEAEAQRRTLEEDRQAEPRPKPAVRRWLSLAASVILLVGLLIGASWLRESVPAIESGPQPVERTASGVQITDTKVGTGFSPNSGQICIVHYTGWLYVNGAKGAKFDSSLDRQKPFSFVLGQHSVIQGWEEGVRTMKVGGKRTLIIPPELAYGSRGAGSQIPPNATLMFAIELLDVKTAS